MNRPTPVEATRVPPVRRKSRGWNAKPHALHDLRMPLADVTEWLLYAVARENVQRIARRVLPSIQDFQRGAREWDAVHLVRL